MGEQGVTRTTAQVLADQLRQAAVEKAEWAAHAVKSPSGLSPPHALQERLWHWHDMRGRSKDKFGVLQPRPGNGVNPNTAAHTPRLAFPVLANSGR
jgi:hypothetical protein